MLRVEELHHTYPGGDAVLKGLTFSIGESERVALLGPNGAGKSTLLLRLTGALAGEGVIELNQKRISEKELCELRRAVGLVFQNPDDQLFSPTVEEDVAYGPLAQGMAAEETELRVSGALEAVKMSHARARFPQNLSGGEKKRVALATILVLDPQLLVLDEPVAGLDARARRSVIEVLKGEKRGLLLATHDLALAQEVAERALVLDEGELVYDGSVEALMKREDLLLKHGLKA